MPLVVLALGLLAIGLLVGTDSIRERLPARDTELVRAAGDIQAGLATAHLWLEEYLGGDVVDLDEIDAHEREAVRLLEAMLGRQTPPTGYTFEPLDVPELRAAAEQILERVEEAVTISQRRRSGFEAGEDVGVGSASDVEYDRLFYDALARLEGLDDILDGRLRAEHRRARLLYRIMLIAWSAIVLLATTGLWTRERRRRAAEEQLRDSRAQLLQAQKMEAVGRLAGGVAHDINNYLAAIIAQCEVVRMKAEQGGRVATKMDAVIQTAGRAATLIQRLLAFSRRQPAQPQVVDLNQVVESLMPMTRRLLGEDIRVNTQLGGDLWSVRIDEAQLEQVIVNLLVNSREAMPGGGDVLIETRNMSATRSRSLRLARGGEHVLLGVLDTGSGIAPELLERIFEPFVTTKDESGGSGLGLATVYGIVRQNGGEIRVQSAPGAGAEFSIYLPRSRASRPREAQGERREEGERPAARVLLVEDNPEVRASTREMLEELGHEVSAVAGGAAALATLAMTGSGVDLVITDVVMPEMSGGELAAQIRQLQPSLPVLFVSGFTDGGGLRKDVEAGRVHFLRKPYSAQELSQRIREVLRASAAGATRPLEEELGPGESGGG